MKKLIGVFLFTVLLLFSWSSPGSAAVLYTNGPGNGNVDAWTINFGLTVADSFTLSSSSTVESIEFWSWVYPGDTPLSVQWAITDAPPGFVTTYGSGTGSLINSVVSPNPNTYGYNIYSETFGISPLTLPAGTYWLSLSNAVTSIGNPFYWDQNDGPSAAWESALGFLVTAGPAGGFPGGPTYSETFEILSTGVPEPCTLLLLGSGLLGLVAFRKKFRA